MWRIRIDTSAGRLALEVRDSDLLLAYFYTLDCQSHTLLKLELAEKHTWWLGLEDARQGMVYLHGYGDRKLGQHKGIRTLSANTGEEQWHRPGLTFYGIEDTGLLAHDAALPEEPLQLLDLRTGEVLQKGISQKMAADRVEAYSRERYSQVGYPILYREGEEYFEQVRDFLAQQLDCEPIKAVEYAETDNGLVISYYVANEKNKLDNFLAVFDLNGFLHLNELLAGGLNGVGSDTFFIFMRSLYFVQNQISLKAYSLNFIVTT
ncbi:DUF4905 domain-containing protein [Pontibacter sp. JH31]|uniref:DUF4905 domain-containing protein n=1 Tax=Pontibacter aquaedesilientis TaxID=2766980 RepID=A0ABR7XBX5_9BACT|nr:DUF4905 domain-containing protein [Pontibacter aquaedesilientis]